MGTIICGCFLEYPHWHLDNIHTHAMDTDILRICTRSADTSMDMSLSTDLEHHMGGGDVDACNLTNLSTIQHTLH
jgi:Uri superfamily endonuclease